MRLNNFQRLLLIGILMGDGLLQKTGRSNARLRLEHSIKQKDYIFWKYEMLKNIMQSKPVFIKRFNPIWKKTYSYYRCQSYEEIAKYNSTLHYPFFKIQISLNPVTTSKQLLGALVCNSMPAQYAVLLIGIIRMKI